MIHCAPSATAARESREPNRSVPKKEATLSRLRVRRPHNTRRP